ncbi:hypothetical protein JTB14_033289 [Gonioctena quinquepunctata]|nr:hypothetical protein JTB14_033289 [Gonioctena quinquepunctata]
MFNCNTHLIGTICKNSRGIPQDIINEKFKEVVAMEKNDGITVVKWKDQRDVRMLYTKHDAQMVERSTRTRNVKNVPEVIMDYNQDTSFVDL